MLALEKNFFKLKVLKIMKGWKMIDFIRNLYENFGNIKDKKLDISTHLRWYRL
jgi:hypothetical protein